MTMTMAAAMTDDTELLRRYASDRAEDAFAELVRRHLDLVHSAALRQVGGNEASAADVAQAVFTEFARQAGRLTRHPALTGWLYTTTHRMAARHVRGETRRQRREQEAHVMQELFQGTSAAEPELDWARLRPVLDDAMHDLGETDRLAVLLRCFEQHPLAEVGARLGLSENAARMRVDRALDKLRAKLAKRGVTSTASALALALTGQAVMAAPTTLVAAITTAALAATVTTSTFGLLSLMASTKLKTTAAALLIAAAGTTIALQQLSARRLRAANAGLRQRADQAAEDARLARQAATQSAEAVARSSQAQPELLRLRGEVGQLRQQLAAARRATPTTASKPAAVTPAASEEEANEAVKQFGIRRLNEAKLLVMGQFLFEGDNNGRPPDSLQAAVDRVKSDGVPKEQAEVLQNLRTDEFELVFKGALKDVGNPSSAIVLREREAWRTPNGRWARTYGFADGHSEVKASDDGDYSAWEAQHQAQPAATGK